MTKNVGAFDGAARTLLAVLFIIYGGYFGPWWISLFVIVPIATATSMWCPLYELVGLNTNNEGSR
jgi:hypothetical protein